MNRHRSGRLLLTLDRPCRSAAGDGVDECTAIVDAVDHAGHERFADELRRRRKTFVCSIDGVETGRQHDPVGIIDCDEASGFHRSMYFDLKKEAEVRCCHLDSVERPSPGTHEESCLFFDLACESLHERLAMVDHPTRRTPVDGAVLPLVLDQKQMTRRVDDHTAGHAPMPERINFCGGLTGHCFTVGQENVGLTCARSRPTISPRYDFVVPERPSEQSSALESAGGSDITTPGMPFESLTAPQPVAAAPPAQARWLGFAAIVLGGVLGAMIGWGTGDVLGGSTSWAAIGALLGAVFGAVGVGIVATLTLRAMNEWNAVQHPEAEMPQGIIGEAVLRQDAGDRDVESADHAVSTDTTEDNS